MFLFFFSTLLFYIQNTFLSCAVVGLVWFCKREKVPATDMLCYTCSLRVVKICVLGKQRERKRMSEQNNERKKEKKGPEQKKCFKTRWAGRDISSRLSSCVLGKRHAARIEQQTKLASKKPTEISSQSVRLSVRPSVCLCPRLLLPVAPVCLSLSDDPIYWCMLACMYSSLASLLHLIWYSCRLTSRDESS